LNIKVKFFILPLLFINLTFAANNWKFIDINIGQAIFWLICSLLIIISKKSIYCKPLLFLFLISIFFKFVSIIFIIEYINKIGDICIALFFIVSGSSIFGKNPFYIFRQLTFFLALCIPFMIIQKIGLHTFFYAWSTELFHPNDIYTYNDNDIGKLFKNLILYPTLFTNTNNLTAVMYQARPTGLLQSNNVLSIFISIALAFYFSFPSTSKIRISDLVIPCIMVLAMSTLVYLIYFILFIFNGRKFHKYKSLFILLGFIFLHFLFFPGLTINGFGISNYTSFAIRFNEIFQSLGFVKTIDFLDQLSDTNILSQINDNEHSYSLIGNIVKSQYFYLIIITTIIFIFIFYQNLKKIRNIKHTSIYSNLLLILLLSQFSINFINAPSFQLLFGVSFYPIISIFNKKTFQKSITYNTF
jgi:hypothetical protein